MLTRKQKLTLEFIRLYSARHGASPTYAEIGLALEISTSAAFLRVQTLVAKGLLTTSRMHRRIVVKHAGKDKSVGS